MSGSISTKNNDLPLYAGLAALVLSSALSTHSSSQLAHLNPKSRAYNDIQVRNISQRVAYLGFSTFCLLNERSIKDWLNSDTLICAATGIGLHFGLRCVLSHRKKSNLERTLGVESEEKPNDLEYRPYNFETPGMSSYEAPPSGPEYVKISFERLEQRTYPSLLDSMLRSAHTIATIGHLSQNSSAIPLLAGTTAIATNLIDQSLRPWGGKIKLAASITRRPNYNTNFPIDEKDAKGSVITPVYTMEFLGRLMNTEDDCSGTNCKAKTSFSTGKKEAPLCLPCLKNAAAEVLEQMIPTASVKSFKKNPLPEENEIPQTEIASYEMSLEMQEDSLIRTDISPISICGIGLFCNGDPAKQGKTRIHVNLTKSPPSRGVSPVPPFNLP